MERPFEAYEGDEPYVFVCYSHNDKALVYPEITRLKDAGYRIWYDEGISPGSEWSDALAEKIEHCTAFLYFVTPRAVTSEHCRREVNFALEQRCRMVAVHLKPTELPSGLKLTLSNRQAIMTHDDPPAAYEAKLARAIGDAGTDASPAPDHRRGAQRRRLFRIWGVAAAATLVGAAVIAVWLSSCPAREVSSFDRSLAVTRLSVIGDDRDAATYADALTQELRTTVTGYQELRVVSVSNAAEASSKNDASYLVSGSVQHVGDRMRVRTNLTRNDDRQTVWAKTFEWPTTAEAADPAQIATTVGRFVRQQLVQDHRCESVRRASSSQEAATAYCAALAERGRFTSRPGARAESGATCGGPGPEHRRRLPDRCPQLHRAGPPRPDGLA